MKVVNKLFPFFSKPWIPMHGIVIDLKFGCVTHAERFLREHGGIVETLKNKAIKNFPAACHIGGYKISNAVAYRFQNHIRIVGIHENLLGVGDFKKIMDAVPCAVDTWMTCKHPFRVKGGGVIAFTYSFKFEEEE